jgi:hypothetical protein
MTADEQVLDISSIVDASRQNKWVAIAPDYSRIVAAADTLRSLMRTVADEDVVFHKVLSRGVSFAPLA